MRAGDEIVARSIADSLTPPTLLRCCGYKNWPAREGGMAPLRPAQVGQNAPDVGPVRTKMADEWQFGLFIFRLFLCLLH